MDTSQDESYTILSVEEELLYLREENARLQRELQDSRSYIEHVTRVCTAVIEGDLTNRITVKSEEELLLGCRTTFNGMLDLLADFTQGLIHSSQSVGSDDGCTGILGAGIPAWSSQGIWREVTSSVNQLASTHINVVRSVAEATIAVSRGDLSRMVTLDLRGEALEMKHTVNGMIRSLQDVAYDVVETGTKVGTRGTLGVQLGSPQREGVWAELFQKVDTMSTTITQLVRAIAIVVTAIDRGDFTQELNVEVEGEMLSLKLSINSMVQTLSTFARGAELSLWRRKGRRR